MRLSLPVLLASLFVLVACGGEDTVANPTDTANTDDAGTDATVDAAPDIVETPGVTFMLENANPGGLARYVQISDARGAPSWFAVMNTGTVDDYYRVHSNCTLCACDEPSCTPCEPRPQTLRLEAGESVTAEWDAMIIEYDTSDTPFCEEYFPVGRSELQVEFVWSPEPPDADGNLPPGTLSRTRLRFNADTDDVVTYRIEALAE